VNELEKDNGKPNECEPDMLPFDFEHCLRNAVMMSNGSVVNFHRVVLMATGPTRQGLHGGP